MLESLLPVWWQAFVFKSAAGFREWIVSIWVKCLNLAQAKYKRAFEEV
ncbi:hypothetical protein [Pontibacter litorisediminis]|nr:hypothetical protein [Pontibacter litorisediminis]